MGSVVHLHTLGTAAIQVGDTRLTPASSRAFAALLYMVAQRGRPVSRGTLHSLLYPTSRDSDGLHSVRQLVYRLRSSGVPLTVDGDCIELSEQDVHVDYATLLGDKPDQDAAERLCNGFLKGFDPSFSEAYGEWFDTFRSETSLRLLHRLLDDLTNHRRAGRWDRAAIAARACLALDPMNEEATLGLAESFAAEGSKVRAIELLDGYAREVGGLHRELCLSATVLRRRIAEQLPDGEYERRNDPPFVGREAEMLQLAHCLELARAGEAQAVFVSGGAGIGKSRLVAESTRVAALRGTRVALVELQRSDARRPLGAFMDVLPALRQMPGALGCSPGAYSLISRLTDGAGESKQPSDGGVYVNASRAIRELLDAICAESPLLLLIEDGQWLDELSLLTLRELSATAHRRLLLLVTSREPRSPDLDTSWRTVSLAPLQDSAAEQLLASFVSATSLQDPQLRKWLLTAGSGNPYFLCELGRHYRATGERFSVPASVKELLSARLDALDDRTTAVFDACVLLGRHATLERLRGVLGIPTLELATALRRLERSALLVDDAPLIRSSHELLSDVAKLRMPSASHKLLDTAIAEVLERDAAVQDDAMRWDAAEHYRDAGNEDAAVRILLASAEQARNLHQVQRAVEYTARAWNISTDSARKVALAEALVRQAAEAADWPRVLDGMQYLRSSGSMVGQQHNDFELCEVDAMYSTGADRGKLIEVLKCCLHASGATPAHRLHAGRRLVCVADEMLDENLAELALSVIDSIPGSEFDELDLQHYRLVYHLTFGDRTVGAAIARAIVGHPIGSSLDMRQFLARQNAAMALYRCGFVSEAGALQHEHYHFAVRHGAAAAAHMSAAILGWWAIDHGDLREGRRWNDIAEAAEARGNFHIIGSGFSANCLRLAILEHRPADARRLLDHLTTHYPSYQAGRMAMVAASDRMRLRQLEGSPADDDEILDFLIDMHPRACRVGIHDDVVATIWYALDERGRTDEANAFLSNYLARERRDGYPPSPEITQIFDTGRFVSPGASS